MNVYPFCTLPPERILLTSAHGVIIRDGYDAVKNLRPAPQHWIPLLLLVLPKTLVLLLGGSCKQRSRLTVIVRMRQGGYREINKIRLPSAGICWNWPAVSPAYSDWTTDWWLPCKVVWERTRGIWRMADFRNASRTGMRVKEFEQLPSWLPIQCSVFIVKN